MFTDIEGSTEMLRRLGDASYSRVLTEHHALVRSGILAYGGREAGTQGDGFFALFSSPTACVSAVVDIQQNLASHEWPDNERVRVRMGIHSGKATEIETGLVGLEVHRAARIAATGHGGQVLISFAAATLLADSLGLGFSLRDLGHHRLKGIGRPVQIFQLVGGGLEAEFPPLRSLEKPSLAKEQPLVALHTEVARGKRSRRKTT